jgi:hypothetical protein
MGNIYKQQKPGDYYTYKYIWTLKSRRKQSVSVSKVNYYKDLKQYKPITTIQNTWSLVKALAKNKT